MKRIVLSFLLILVVSQIKAQPLAQRLDSLLFNDPMLRTSEVGITVYDLTTGESLFQYQDELRGLVGCHPWGHTDSDTTETTSQQQQQQQQCIDIKRV